MAGWSILSHGSGLESEKGGGNSESKVGCVDVDQKVGGGFDDSEVDEERVKSLFDQVLSAFMNEAACRGCIRPMPAMLADGQTMDLFKLFKAVRERGGFDLVSVNDLWTFVAVDLGLHIGFSVPVKLMYHNYLRELEKYFAGNGGRRLGNGECDSGGGNFGLLSLVVEKEFRGLLEYWPNQINKNDRRAMVVWKRNDGVVDMDIEKSELYLWDVKNRHARKYVGKRRRGDDEKLRVYDPRVTKKRSAYLKIQQESLPLPVMLNWVTQIATCPDDPSIRKTTEPFKWKALMEQAIRTREGLLRHPWSNAQKKLKMHPSMYDDDSTDLSTQSTERLRCSGRLAGVGKSRSCSCCNSDSATECKQTRTGKRHLESRQKKKTPATDDSSATTTKVVASWSRPHEFDVPVGPHFQANIPEWTGVVVESDSKWLGTKVWPPADGDNSLVEMDGGNSIGRGRPGSCGCPVPGSVNCVRFHIAENRMKVKLEVGVVFFYWRFHHMGEEVSLRWTSKEESMFKDIMMYDPPSKNKSFWQHFPDCFRRKTRKDLVSYFWNVFIIHRRSYQNRVSPKDIDTDDESEFGSLSERYGQEAVTVPISELLICAENKQCTDFD